MYLPHATTRALVLGSQELDARRRWPTAVYVPTPLDLIQELERRGHEIATVIVTGDRHDVVDFLRDAYPQIEVTIDPVRARSLTPVEFAFAT